MELDLSEVPGAEDSGTEQLVGVETGFPCIHARVYKTPGGVSYLRTPGVALIAKPQTNLDGARAFLAGFDDSLDFDSYVDDDVPLSGGAQLVKFAGQLCYASFGPKRTTNAQAAKYLDNIKEQKHGSVTAHASYSFLTYGLSRSLTHEAVRHGIGTAFSQLSQRFVSGAVLRFVERPEFQTDPELHELFIRRAERSAAEYESIANRLFERQASGDTTLSADRRTDLRKRVQQAARACLPNETETFMVLSGNIRAWRHMIEMRASEHAEVEIRAAYMRIFRCLSAVEPLLFSDYQVVRLKDGTEAVTTPFMKI